MAKQIEAVYGEALFACAGESGKRRAWMGEAQLLLEIFKDNPELSLFLNHPGIEREEKIKTMEAIFRKPDMDGPIVSEELLRFLKVIVEKGKKDGYVTTMFGRRRPIPELKSSNFMQRSFGERIAMNSPIQGTAADIIKIAMNRVYQRLQREGLQSRLILQVHDELLIETREEELEQVSGILEEEMRKAASLDVALEVDMHTGKNWYEAK